jgi:hypothetical protein
VCSVSVGIQKSIILLVVSESLEISMLSVFPLPAWNVFVLACCDVVVLIVRRHRRLNVDKKYEMNTMKSSTYNVFVLHFDSMFLQFTLTSRSPPGIEDNGCLS